ncbi:hypothetical protein HPB50_012581 [Hyalomma asiaticum]|uniref:Uncharacterized protein n=1 Tax=Hyalomma asiaticum TaxID=266040 RepID=A0ACB7S147_HYAAI|nr:hypothetical protein HPB50_012581 [Hyalomma asiaticum]
MSRKRLAITYPGHEPKRKPPAKKCAPRGVTCHRRTASSEGEDRRWLCVNGFSHAKWSAIPKKFVARCVPVVWSFLQACVSLGCLFLVFLFFHPNCLDSKELQVEALRLTLQQHLVGQDIAVNRTVTAIARYLNSSESAASVPLVLVYVGCSGCGKTYALSLIAKHYPYTETLVASHKIALTRKTGNDLLHWLRYSLSSWRPNVIVIDDIDLGLDTVRPTPLDDPFGAQLETVLSTWEKARVQRGQAAIFILSLSGGGNVAEGFALKQIADVHEQETTEDIEKLIEAYRGMFPPWLRNAEIVPFLPLNKADAVPAQVSSIHCHKNQSDEADVDVSARRRLICASILCLTFMLFELIEVIGALTSVIMIWAVTGVLVYMAIQRMISKEYNIDATIMLISASVGVVVNIIMGVALQIHPTSPLGHSHGSEESARRCELPSTEPFVPHGVTASEMDLSRHYSHLDVVRAVGSRSLQAMSPQHVAEVGTSGHSASAPSMSSPPYNPSGPERPSAHRHETTGRDEAVVLHEDVTEQRGAKANAVPTGSQQANSSVSSEDNSVLDFAAIRSGVKRHLASSASGNVPDNAVAASAGTAAAAASVDGQLGVSHHDPGTSPEGLDRGAPDSRSTSAASLAQTPPQQQPVASATPGGAVSHAPAAEAGNASPDPPARSSTESRGVMNINVRAAFIHVLGDLIQSVGVLIAAVVIYFCPSCGVVDPVCTLMFSVIVLVTTLAILREALNVLMEGIPHSVDYHQVKRLLLSVDGVARVHDLHIWALSLDKLAVSAHVVLGEHFAASAPLPVYSSVGQLRKETLKKEL